MGAATMQEQSVEEDEKPPAAAPSLRPEALEQAAKFLATDAVKRSPDVEGKVRFLAKKGMSQAEIQEALTRAGIEAPLQAPPPPPPQKTQQPLEQGVYSNKFLQVLQAVQNGETLPGINPEVQDQPLENAVVEKKNQDRPLKPWEKKGGSKTKVAAKPAAKAAPPVGAASRAPSTEVAPPPSRQWLPSEPARWDSTDLKDYDGSDPARAVLLSLKGTVFD